LQGDCDNINHLSGGQITSQGICVMPMSNQDRFFK
jgi:hypothetical protein